MGVSVPDGAGAQGLREVQRLLDVLRVNGGGEPVLRVVRALDHVIESLYNAQRHSQSGFVRYCN